MHCRGGESLEDKAAYAAQARQLAARKFAGPDCVVACLDAGDRSTRRRGPTGKLLANTPGFKRAAAAKADRI